MWKELLSFTALFATFSGLVVAATFAGPSDAQVAVSTRGASFTQDDLTQYGSEESSLLRTLPQARDASDLTRLVDMGTNLIVVDRTTIESVDSAFLRSQLESGVSILGLNVPLAELAAATDFVALFNRVQRPIEHDLRGLQAPPPAEPFYSIVRMVPPGAKNFGAGWSQKAFASGIFDADFEKHLAGAYSEVGITR